METRMSRIRKRDGSIVSFDQGKITSAIFKAAKSVGGKDRRVAQQLSDRVVAELGKLESTPSVEQIQDLVERVLIEEGHASTAKAYILYRQERAAIRKEKQLVLEKEDIDEVDKRFDVNALRVLKARYLRKDTTGKLIETPKGLFTRVAVHAALPDLFYDARVFDINAKQPVNMIEDFKPAVYEYGIGNYKLNRYHLEALKRMYNRFNRNKQMKVAWGKFFEMIKTGQFNDYEKNIDTFYNLMTYKLFMPNTPAIANFGNPLGMGSACFVLDVPDSIDGIMETLKSTAIVFKAGGGMGYNFSKLRPEGDFVSSTGGVASGPLSFMRLFDTMTEVIKQGGIRRGANMGILNSNHPDIEKFITAKDGNKSLRNFNISVLIMPDFWEHYEKNEPYPLVNPKDGTVVKTVNPRVLFDKIVYQAWESAEPGVIFFDKVNDYNPFYEHLGPIVTTNPCLTGDTLISTRNGFMPIKEIAEKYPNGGIELVVNQRVQSGNLFSIVTAYVSEFRAFKTGIKQTIKITTKTGKQLKCTPDHKILTIDGWKEAYKLTEEDGILVDSEESIDKLHRIELNGVEEVYDLTEPLTHSFIANGIVVHNCGEVLLYPNEPCNLGSINVWAFARQDEEGNTHVDWDALKEVIRSCTRFLDNVIDVNNFPLQAIEEMSLATRKIGLGIMGLGDLLYELRLPYNTEEGRRFMEQLMEFIAYWSKVESIELARTRGNLPYYDKSFYKKGRLPIRGADLRQEWHFDWDKISEDIKRHGIRNGYTTIIAPTGSISMIAGCSSGMEPVYSLVFEKNVKVGSFYYVDPAAEKVLREEGLYNDKLMEDINEHKGSIQWIKYVPERVRKALVTAMDITPEDHIRALASFQKWVDSSISKTNNFPADATLEHMRESYILAYKLGCKDVTVFRDSSIKDQVLVAPKSKEAKEEAKVEIKQEQKKTIKESESGLVFANGNGSEAKPMTKATIENCPECGTKVELKEGCLHCPGCGWGLCM
ncbi:ribonucleoside-diphosphate reductase, adenosylcobalamin-dependent [Candidatus Woesearchaeota archaeon]|nr:ribonucleoside-diphosphate reductase, adenosylcobalamin-dependent [Candidatus Woesearchaeota archaeon]